MLRPSLVLCAAALLAVGCGERDSWTFRAIGHDEDGVLFAASYQAAQRWQGSAGLDVTVRPDDGDHSLTIEWVSRDRMRRTPGSTVPNLTGSDDTLAGGLTVNPAPGIHHILIRDDLAPDLALAVATHEMAHVMTESGQHSPRGVFAARNDPGQRITLEDLETVCERASCAWMRPED